MLARAGLGDEAGFAHLPGQQGLTQHVVDLVGPGVVQILPFEIDLRAPQVLGHAPGIVEPGGPSGVLIQQFCELRLELRVVFVVIVGLLQLVDRVHQGFGDVLTAVDAKSSLGHVLIPLLRRPPPPVFW